MTWREMPLRKSSLSSCQLRLLRLMQRLQYGAIHDLAVRGGEPDFTRPCRAIRSVKLAHAPSGDKLLPDGDFELKREAVALFDLLSRIADGVVPLIEVQGGLPVRVNIPEQDVA